MIISSREENISIRFPYNEVMVRTLTPVNFLRSSVKSALFWKFFITFCKSSSAFLTSGKITHISGQAAWIFPNWSMENINRIETNSRFFLCSTRVSACLAEHFANQLSPRSTVNSLVWTNFPGMKAKGPNGTYHVKKNIQTIRA